MSEADLLRQYAKEVISASSKTTDENEKQSLIDLACTWAQAALMSERALGSSFISSPRDVGEATSVSLSDLL
jgi:hypothetical protein